jgi:hypothetical protein
MSDATEENVLEASGAAGVMSRRFNEHEVLIAATRYYIGRKTIATVEHARRLAEAWEDLPEHTREVIKRDLQKAFDRDDLAREQDQEYLPLGGICDRAAWEKVRNAWQDAA